MNQPTCPWVQSHTDSDCVFLFSMQSHDLFIPALRNWCWRTSTIWIRKYSVVVTCMDFLSPSLYEAFPLAESNRAVLICMSITTITAPISAQDGLLLWSSAKACRLHLQAGWVDVRWASLLFSFISIHLWHRIHSQVTRQFLCPLQKDVRCCGSLLNHFWDYENGKSMHRDARNSYNCRKLITEI